MFRKKDGLAEPIVVPEKIRKRAQQAVALGGTQSWIDQTMFLIGRNTTHHEPGDPLLEESIDAAYALVSMLVEMKRREELSL